MKINYKKVVAEFNKIANRGFCSGLGDVGGKGQMCVEAAISTAMGLPGQEDRPKCVLRGIAMFKIWLNDARGWSSDKARTKGLRNLGIAQLGSKDVITAAQWRGAIKKALLKIIPDFDHDMPWPLAKQCWAGKITKAINPYADGGERLIDFVLREDWVALLRELDEEQLFQVSKVTLQVLKDLKSPGIKYLKK